MYQCFAPTLNEPSPNCPTGIGSDEMPEKSERLMELLREINREIGKFVKELLAEQDLPMVMMMMARQIEVEPGITISELARRTNIAKSHISNNIRGLESRGWVEKRADDADQRLVRLYLTPIATKDLELIRRNIRERLNALVTDVSDEQVNELIRGLEDIKAAIGNLSASSALNKEP